MTDALIIDACRTPRGIGKAGKGALAEIHPQRLGAAVLEALVQRNGIDTADVDDVVWGTNAQRGVQSNDLGRMSALDAGYDVRSSGVTLDRFCGSGLSAAAIAAASIMSGMEDLVVADLFCVRPWPEPLVFRALLRMPCRQQAHGDAASHGCCNDRRRALQEKNLLRLVARVVQHRHARVRKEQAGATGDRHDRLQPIACVVAASGGAHALVDDERHRRVVFRHAKRGGVDERVQLQLVVDDAEMAAVRGEAEVIRVFLHGE